MRHLFPSAVALAVGWIGSSCALPEYEVVELAPAPDHCDGEFGFEGVPGANSMTSMVPLPGGYCMDETEVTAILGKADSCDEIIAYRSCRWGSEDRHIDVRLVAGKVVLFNARGL